MNISREVVQILIQNLFPSQNKQNEVLRAFEHMKENEKLIRLCKIQHVDFNRLQVALLKLSNGNDHKLKENIEGAYEDPRDIVSWAEEPNLVKASMQRSKPVTGVERETLQKKDADKYQAWLRRCLPGQYWEFHE